MRTCYNSIMLKLLLFYSIINCNTLPLDLHKMTQSLSFYQVTSFVSDNFTKISSFQKTFLFQEFPNKIHSFDANNNQKRLYGNTSRSGLENLYSLEKSLIVFYTSNLYETKSFIDFLVSQLSVKHQRSKSLVYYSNNSEDNIEIDVIHALKYAWEKKFLDFSILVTSNIASSLIYHVNPFNNIVYKKTLGKSIEIFPAKLQNAHGYPFYVLDDLGLKLNFKSNLIPEILNLSIVRIRTFKYSRSLDLLEKYNADRLLMFIFSDEFDISNSTRFLTQQAKFMTKYIALVPILFYPKMRHFFETLSIVTIVLGTVLTIFHLLKRFVTPFRSVGIFEVIQLILSQPIKSKPKRIITKIIYLTVIIGSVKLLNDILLVLISIVIKQEEIPFETFKDLYDSKLKTYTYIDDNSWHERYISGYDQYDDYLLKIINSTAVNSNEGDQRESCINMLAKWKNVSCIMNDYNARNYVTEYRNPNGSPMIKIAQPEIFQDYFLEFTWFGDASPYAMKFSKIQQRIDETKLMYWHLSVYDIGIKMLKKVSQMKTDGLIDDDDGIKAQSLIFMLFIGYTIAVAAFILELIIAIIRMNKSKHLTVR